MAPRSSGGKHNYFTLAQIAIAVSVAILLVLGLVMVYSTDSIESITLGKDPTSSLFKQALCVAAGAIALVLGRQLGFLSRFGVVVIALNVISIGLLVYTYFFGENIYGATRWINVPFFGSFQASEYCKIVIIITAAYLLSRYKCGRLSLRMLGVLAAGGILLPLAIIMVVQSDFGSTLVCMVGIIAACWIAGLDKKYFCIGLGAIAIVALLAVAIAPYRLVRILSFLGGNSDSEGDALQITQSLYAIAQGGLFGVGIGNSTQKYQYLPEAETDFIFAILVEELGAVGAIAVILLFLVILIASLYIALNASDDFGQILVAGLGVMLVFQAYFNIAVILGIAPITGKTLPFLSKGGTSLVMNCLIVGLILSVAKDSNPEALAKKRRDNLHVVSGGGPANSSGSYGYGNAVSSSRGGSRSSSRNSSAHTSSTRFRATSYRSNRR